MQNNPFFCLMTSRQISEIIDSATKYVCFAGPSMQREPAISLARLATRIGPEMITVSLDFNENVFRMGFGSIEAISMLRGAGIQIMNSPSLRSALVIVDDQGYSFTPTALYLEAEAVDSAAVNAIRLSEEQVKEALARLSPAAKAIAKAQASTEEEANAISSLSVEVQSNPVLDSEFTEISNKLATVPPTKFDLARQVRVFNALIQYVDIQLIGAAIQKRKLKIPLSLQKLGSSKELEGRIHTTFDLIEKNGKLSSKPLENELNDIRKLTPSLGNTHGRILRKEIKVQFEKRIREFRSKIDDHRETATAELQGYLNASKEDIIKYYIPQVMEHPPEELIAQSSGGVVSRDMSKKWLDAQLARVFPSANNLIGNMNLIVTYKDVTYETLKDKDFVKSLKAAFEYTDWDKHFNEFQAVGEVVD